MLRCFNREMIEIFQLIFIVRRRNKMVLQLKKKTIINEDKLCKSGICSTNSSSMKYFYIPDLNLYFLTRTK